MGDQRCPQQREFDNWWKKEKHKVGGITANEFVKNIDKQFGSNLLSKSFGKVVFGHKRTILEVLISLPFNEPKHMWFKNPNINLLKILHSVSVDEMCVGHDSLRGGISSKGPPTYLRSFILTCLFDGINHALAKLNDDVAHNTECINDICKDKTQRVIELESKVQHQTAQIQTLERRLQEMEKRLDTYIIRATIPPPPPPPATKSSRTTRPAFHFN